MQCKGKTIYGIKQMMVQKRLELLAFIGSSGFLKLEIVGLLY